MKLAASLSVLFGFLLSSCAGSPIDITRKQQALLDYKGKDAGFVFASISLSKPFRLSYANVTFRRMGTEDLFSFSFAPRQGILSNGMDSDFETAAFAGVVKVEALPPGDYELFSASTGQYAQYGYRCTLPLPRVAFQIGEAQLRYLGRYVVSPAGCLLLAVSDEESEDAALVKPRLPAKSLAKLQAVVPKGLFGR